MPTLYVQGVSRDFCHAVTLKRKVCPFEAESKSGLCAVHDPDRKCKNSWCEQVRPADGDYCGTCTKPRKRWQPEYGPFSRSNR